MITVNINQINTQKTKQLCTQSASDFIQIGSLLAELQPNA